MRQFFNPDEPVSYAYLQVSLNRYTFASQFTGDKVVLDVGCGAGYGSSYLARNAKRVIGVDISKEAVDCAREHYPKDGLDFITADATKLPFPRGSFDVVVAFEVLEHVKEYESLLRECKRVTKNGGMFICSTPTKEFMSPGSGKPASAAHFREFYVSEFCQLLAELSNDVTFYGQLHCNWINKTKARIQKRIAKRIAEIMGCVPMGKQFKSFIKKFMRDYKDMILSELKEGDFDKLLDRKYQPVPLQSRLTPNCIIAVLRVRQRE